MIDRSSLGSVMLASLGIVGLPACALADVLVLTNGDRITGEVQHIWDDTVTIEPEYADPIDVDLDVIAHIESDRDFDVTLDDGYDGTAKLTGAADGGQQVLETPDGPRNIALADVFELDEPEEYQDWNSHVDFSSSLNSGNTDSENTKLRADGMYKRGDHRHRGEVTFFREELEGVQTQEQDLYVYDYNWLFNDPWFFSSELSYEQDPIRELDHRVTLSAGIGYDIWATPRKTLSIKLGAGYLDEEIALISNESAVAIWGLRFWHEFVGGDLSVFHNHTITDNVSGRDNTIFKTATGLSYEISDLLYSNVSLNFDYETEPVETAEHEDLALLLGLGFEFE